MIEANALTVIKSHVRLLDSVSFHAQTGVVTALLGVRGCGKTSLMDVLGGCMAPDGGQVSVDGVNLADSPTLYRQKVGYAPSQSPVYPDMTIRAYMKFVADARELSSRESTQRASELIKITGLDALADKPIRTLAPWALRRISIAQALLHNPSVLLIDQSDQEMEPKEKCELRELLAKLCEGRTVLFSTDNLSDALSIASRVIVLDGGRIVSSGAAEQLDRMRYDTGKLCVRVRGANAQVREALGAFEPDSVAPCEEPGAQDVILGQPGADMREALFYTLCEKKLPILRMEPVCAPLDDVLRRLTTDSLLPDKEA